ncbi:MAG: NAD(P)-dependent alcohol dehydrogenase [Deltaproteobacteria bacterium]|nr:MAG: NAD(P)-dependent alcohol dehydrogenase [Deltaproteobacteria bacterium]
MKFAAFAALAAKQSLLPYEYEPAAIRPQDVEVQISHCGICHSDLHLIDNDWSSSPYPLVPGHEIVGTVTAAGDRCRLAAGQRVGVGWQRSACFDCEQCRAGDENLCARQEATCVGHMGGFARRIRLDGRFVFPLPESLEAAAAAPLLCAGVTVFAPLRRWGVVAGAQVGVIGIGGLGHLALQFLRAMGCETTAFTSSPDKRAAAERLGARHVVSSTSVREIRANAGRFEFLLCTAPARLDFITYLQTLKPGGILCLVGAPPGLLQIPAAQLLASQRVICGSDIGSRSAIRETLAFAAEHGIAAQVETVPLADVNAALQRVRENRVRYRMVLTN